MRPVCLILGAGAGIGGHVAKRFARGGYHAVMCRRSKREGLEKFIVDIESEGGSAEGRIFNAVEPNAIETCITEIEEEVGPIEVVLFNLGAQIGNRKLMETSYKQFELGWRLASFALFRLAHSLIPYMESRSRGTILVTSATASMRGNAGQHSHASAMGGRRLLCQSLNAEFGSKGIHIAEGFEALRVQRGREKDGLILPEKVAETYWHIAQQHRSTWTFETDLRSFDDAPWWND